MEIEKEREGVEPGSFHDEKEVEQGSARNAWGCGDLGVRFDKLNELGGESPIGPFCRAGPCAWGWG